MCWRTNIRSAHLRELQLKVPEHLLFTYCSLWHIEHLYLINVQDTFTVADFTEILRLRILSAPVTAHRITMYFVLSCHTQPWTSERGEKGSIPKWKKLLYLFIINSHLICRTSVWLIKCVTLSSLNVCL